MKPMYNHYDGNSGRFHRVEEEADHPSPPPGPPPFPGPPPPFPPPPFPPPPGPPPGPPEDRDPPGLLARLAESLQLHLETEDLLLALILYLLYRETGDTEFLLILAGVLLL